MSKWKLHARGVLMRVTSLLLLVAAVLLIPAPAAAKRHTWNIHSVTVPQPFPSKQSHFQMLVPGDHTADIVLFETIDPPATLGSRTVTFDGTNTVITWNGSFPQGVSPTFGYQIPTGCLDYPPYSYNWTGISVVSAPDFNILEPQFGNPGIRLVNHLTVDVRVVKFGTIAPADTLSRGYFGIDSLPPTAFTLDPGTPFVVPADSSIDRPLPAVGNAVVVYAELEYANLSPYPGTVMSWSQVFEAPGCPEPVPAFDRTATGVVSLLLLGFGAMVLRTRRREAPTVGIRSDAGLEDLD